MRFRDRGWSSKVPRRIDGKCHVDAFTFADELDAAAEKRVKPRILEELRAQRGRCRRHTERVIALQERKDGVGRNGARRRRDGLDRVALSPGGRANVELG